MTSNDPIEQYLTQLRTRLRVPRHEAELILAEAEDHLRETAATGLAAGMTEREARDAAISSFGSVQAVVRAHEVRQTGAAAIIDLGMAAWKLGSLGLLAVGASGLVAAGMNAAFGRSFVGAAPAGARFGAAACKYWLSIWPSAHSCAQAAMLESSSDAVSLRVAAGMAGLMLLALYLVARRFQQRYRPGREVLTTRFFPPLAVACFAAIAMGLTLATVFGLRPGVPAGPGSYLSGAVAALALAVGYGARMRLTREAGG
jgi:hypothetical protein